MYICKSYKPLLTCENDWLHRLVLCRCPHIIIFSQFFFVEKMLHVMVKKTMDHVFSNLAFVIVFFVSFDLWTSWGGVDIFALVINFLSDT